MLYFDNASTTYVYPEVLEKVAEVIQKDWGNPMNLYSFGLEAKQIIEEARYEIARAIGADPDEIIFTSCSSESNAMAIHQKKRCLCSPYEHHDVKDNEKTTIVDEDYLFTLEQIMKTNNWDTSLTKEWLYAHMLVNNETGEIFNVKPLIEQAHKLKMWALVDATQALGNIPINAHDLNADFMSFSFHKVHAPKGIGAIYIKKSIQDQISPLIYGSQEFGLRGGTSNVPYIAGAGIAVKKAISEMREKDSHCEQLQKKFVANLFNKKTPFIINKGKNNISSILNVSFKGITGDALMLALDNEGVSVSTGSACNSGDQKPSEVLSYMRVPEEFIHGAIRISFSLENSIDDVDFLTEKIIKVYKELVG